MDEQLSPELQKQILRIIKTANSKNVSSLTKSEVIILFHWVRYRNEPRFNFVPKKYRMF